MIPAGERNRKVQIQRIGGAPDASAPVQTDSYGQPVDTGSAGWVTIRTPWAAIAPQDQRKTSQNFQNGEFTEHVTTLITFRWSKSDRITTADRVVYTEQGSGLVHTYNINDIVNPGQRNEDIILVCTELDGEG